jgi:hypothetical protein
MTEKQWLSAKRVSDFLDHPTVWDHRKRRLLFCACSRRVLRFLVDDRFQHALNATEDYADQRLTWTELKVNARSAAVAARDELFASGQEPAVRDAAVAVTRTTSTFLTWEVLTLARLAIANGEGLDLQIEESEHATQLQLARDIFGNPFRPVTFSDAWRTSTTAALARQMYESRDFGAMPILADALQEAGCDSEGILSHCRDAKQLHVRGCWVVDLVLGKA